MKAVVVIVLCIALAHAVNGLSFRNTISAGLADKFNPTFFQTATPRNNYVLLTRSDTAPVQNPNIFFRNIFTSFPNINSDPVTGNPLAISSLTLHRVVATGAAVDNISEGDLVYSQNAVCIQLTVRLNSQRANGGGIPAYCLITQDLIFAVAQVGPYGGNRASLDYSSRFNNFEAMGSSYNSRYIRGAGKASGFYANAVEYYTTSALATTVFVPPPPAPVPAPAPVPSGEPAPAPPAVPAPAPPAVPAPVAPPVAPPAVPPVAPPAVPPVAPPAVPPVAPPAVPPVAPPNF